MTKSVKIIVGIFIGLLVLIISLIILNNYAEKRIKQSLDNGLKNLNATYDEVDVNILNRSVELVNPSIIFKGKTLDVDAIKLENIHIWDYIKNKEIIVGKLNISKPIVKFYNLKEIDSASVDTTQNQKTNSETTEFKQNIQIKNIKVTGGSFEIFEKDSTNHRLYTKFDKINLDEVKINAQTLKEQIPFDYDIILLNADSIFYDLDSLQIFTAGNFVIDNNNLLIKRLELKPKYSKTDHQQHIIIEKDWYDLEVDSLSIKNLNWTVENDSLQITNDLVQLTNPRFHIYRDKSKEEDNSFKPLYSKMLREASLKMGIDSLNISNASIKYEEKINAEKSPGVVEFSNLNVSIANLTNIDLDRKDFPKTMISAKGKFMQAATITAEWEFFINDTSDDFTISGYMGGLRAENINKFLRPALNIEASGDINDLYYNFGGNNYGANGEIRLDYKNFKVDVLRKDGSGKNEVVSALANLIIRNKAVSEKRNYKEISVERDTNKSFWNFLWKCVRTGALKSFT